MAGFLDKKDRIVDMVLTGEGKYLLSAGKLNFAYWRAFDDEVDYSPSISRDFLSRETLNNQRIDFEYISSSLPPTASLWLGRHTTDASLVQSDVVVDASSVEQILGLTGSFSIQSGTTVFVTLTQNGIALLPDFLSFQGTSDGVTSSFLIGPDLYIENDTIGLVAHTSGSGTGSLSLVFSLDMQNPFATDVSNNIGDADVSASIDFQIQETLVREATTGYKRFNLFGLDQTNVRHPIFTMPHGQVELPRMLTDDRESLEIDVKQRKLSEVHVSRDQFGNVIQVIGPFDRGCQRYDSSSETVDLKHSGFPSDYRPDGFLLKVLVSGTHGYTEVVSRRDSTNTICFNADLEVVPKGIG